MTDNIITLDNKPKRGKYNKDVDAPRMKVYMESVRIKNKAGYHHMTVKQWKLAGSPGLQIQDKAVG